MNILFIGNSYTYYNDMPALFEKLALENGRDVKVFSVTKGNRKLYENLSSGDEYAERIDKLLGEYRFEYVFLQEYSTLPLTDNGAFEKGVAGLCEKAARSAKNIVLYETWSRKEGNPVLAEYGWTVRSMTSDLAKAYCEAGKKTGASVSYVGLNFYELEGAVELYDEDKTHPSYKGSCLAALTHYHHVFGSFPDMTDSMSLDAGDVALFKKAVENTAKINDCLN